MQSALSQACERADGLEDEQIHSNLTTRATDQLGLPGTEGFPWMQDFSFHFILFYFIISFHFILFVCMEGGGTFHFKTRKIPANQDSLVTYPHCTLSYSVSPKTLYFMQGAESSCTHTPHNSPGIYVPFYRLPSKATLSPENIAPRHLLFVDKVGEEFYFSLLKKNPDHIIFFVSAFFNSNSILLLKKNLDHIAFFVNVFFSSCFSKSPYFPRLGKCDVSKRHLKYDTGSRASLLRESATCYEPRYVDTKSKLCLSHKSRVPENTAQELLMVPVSKSRLCRLSSEAGFQGVRATGNPVVDSSPLQQVTAVPANTCVSGFSLCK